MNQSNVQIVALGIDRHNPDVPAIVVMNEILGGGFGSRLFQKVRTQLGLAYAVGGGFDLPYDHPGTFRVEVLTKSVSTVDATKAAEAEIAGLNTKPFTAGELQARQGQHPQLVPLPLRHAATKFSPSASGSSSTAIRPIILRPIAPPSKKSRSPT